jgi:hypothetical protein
MTASSPTTNTRWLRWQWLQTRMHQADSSSERRCCCAAGDGYLGPGCAAAVSLTAIGLTARASSVKTTWSDAYVAEAIGSVATTDSPQSLSESTPPVGSTQPEKLAAPLGGPSGPTPSPKSSARPCSASWHRRHSVARFSWRCVPKWLVYTIRCTSRMRSYRPHPVHR